MASDGISAFTVHDKQVYMKLHNDATRLAAAKIGISSEDKAINQFIANSGCTDGKVILDRTDSALDASFNQKKMEVAVIFDESKLECTAKPSLLDSEGKESEIRKIMSVNEKELLDARGKALLAINEYFRGFAFTEKAAFKEDDLVFFIPDFNQKHLQVQVGGDAIAIKQLDAESTAAILAYYVADPFKFMEKLDEEKYKQQYDEFAERAAGGYDLMVGFKVGYTVE